MFLLLVTLVSHTVNTLLVYDRQTLLDLRISAKNLVHFDSYGQKTLPSFLSEFPSYICRTPASPALQKRPRRQGKRSGCLVRLRAGLVHFDQRGYGAAPHLCISGRSLDPVTAWLLPVVGSYGMFQPCGPCSPCLRWCGVNGVNLRPLCRATLSAVCPDPTTPARFGLVNARSLANKSFIHKDFFLSRELDFLFISETWLSVGESSVFTKLLPDECCFFKLSADVWPRRRNCDCSLFKCKQLSLSGGGGSSVEPTSSVDRKDRWFESRLPGGGTELHVRVSLSKILNPKFAPDVQLAPCNQ